MSENRFFHVSIVRDTTGPVGEQRKEYYYWPSQEQRMDRRRVIFVQYQCMNQDGESVGMRHCLLIETTTLLADKGGKTIPIVVVALRSLYSVERS